MLSSASKYAGKHKNINSPVEIKVSYQRYQRGKKQHTTANVNNEGENEFLGVKRNKEARRELITENNSEVTFESVYLLTVTVARLFG